MANSFSCMYLLVVVLAERDLVVALRMAPAWFLVEKALDVAELA